MFLCCTWQRDRFRYTSQTFSTKKLLYFVSEIDSINWFLSSTCKVYATDGDDTLGGSDFDLCLYNKIKQKLASVTGGTITLDDLTESDKGHLVEADRNNSNVNDDDSRSAYCLSASVRAMAEQIKKDLSFSDSVLFKCIPVRSNSNPLPDIPDKIKFPIFRKEDFEDGCGYLFNRGILPGEMIHCRRFQTSLSQLSICLSFRFCSLFVIVFAHFLFCFCSVFVLFLFFFCLFFCLFFQSHVCWKI